MPILDINNFLCPAQKLSSDITFGLARTCSEILCSEPWGTWVKLRVLESSQNSDYEAQPGAEVVPVFVKLLKYIREPKVMAEEARRSAYAIGIICNRQKENVHILVEPQGCRLIALRGGFK